MQKSKEWVRWRTFIKPATCFECFIRNSKIFSYEELARIGEPKLHENCGCRLEQLLAIVAGYATELGTMGADWWLYHLKELPDYYIFEDDAKALGWVNVLGNFDKVAPGKMMYKEFENRDGILPEKKNRLWYEADINYKGGYRNKQRVVFSNDGPVFVTYDHYKTFMKIIGEEQ